MSAPLAALAAWDVDRLRASTGTLAASLDRLGGWVPRLDALGRQLGTAPCWSGPAAGRAAAQVVAVSTAATDVGRGLAGCAGHLRDALGAAGPARSAALSALAAAAAAGIALDADGRPDPPFPRPGPATAPDQQAALADRAAAAVLAQAHAAQAHAHAAATALALRGAADALAALAPLTALTPADLLTAPPPALPRLPCVAPLPPAGADPATVAAWWSGLGSADRQALVTADPGLVGGLDGLPAWARDAANRTLLARTLAAPRDGGEARTAAAVAARLAEVERTGTVAQLQQFDPAQGLVALSVGDLDTADAVDVLVPGMNTTVDDDLGGWVTDAERVGAAARAAAPGLSVAGLVWFGYRTPTLLTVARRGPAERAAPVLDRALDGLAATRAGRPARVTVVAHSYGTLALGLAARQPGRLAADAVVLLGSPGVAVADASGLEAPEVHVAAAPADPVPHLADARVLGREPDEPGFGAAELPTDGAMGHSDYLDPGHPTLAAVGAVVAGRAPR